MPVNLLERAWFGSMPLLLFKAYPRPVLAWLGGVLGLAVLAAGAVALLFNNPAGAAGVALIIVTWLSPAALFIVYLLSTRDARILRPGTNGGYFLDNAKWFRNADIPIKESDALIENGKRVFWLVARGYCLDPLVVWNMPSPSKTAKTVGSAQIAGIKGYTVSGSSYAFKKTLTRQDQIKLGLMVAGIAILLIGLFMMTGRLIDGPA